jgi:hypothetical protein
MCARPLRWAWTGSRLIVWGGYIYLGYDEDPLADGYVLDPLTGDSEPLPPAPLPARASPATAWTGTELIVWAGDDLHGGSFGDGAAYDPASNTWRAIADGPIELTDGMAIWSGKEMIVFGAALHGGSFPETPVAIGAAYDPVIDSWRRIADSELPPQASTASWRGSNMVRGTT